MKTTLIIYCISILASLTVFGEQISDQDRVIQKHGRTFITWKQRNDQCFLEIDGKSLCEIKAPYRFSPKPIVFSPDKKLFAAQILSLTKDSNTISYAGILIVRFMNEKWVPDKELILKDLPGKYKSIWELGAVNNLGTAILAQFQTYETINDEELLFFAWETWSHDGKKLSEGLTIEPPLINTK